MATTTKIGPRTIIYINAAELTTAELLELLEAKTPVGGNWIGAQNIEASTEVMLKFLNTADSHLFVTTFQNQKFTAYFGNQNHPVFARFCK